MHTYLLTTGIFNTIAFVLLCLGLTTKSKVDFADALGLIFIVGFVAWAAVLLFR